jgi:hypothetical protein
MSERSPVRRVNVIITEQQYEKLSKAGINISGLVRSLIEDHLSHHVITLGVSKKTYDFYAKIVANTGAEDKDIEPLLLDSLRKLLDQRIEKIKKLQSEIGA